MGKNGTIDDDHQHAVQGYVVTGLGLMGCAEQGSENPVVSKGGGYGTPVPPTLLDVRKCRKTLETQKNARLYSTKMEVYLRESPKKGPPLRFWTSGSVERRRGYCTPPLSTPDCSPRCIGAVLSKRFRSCMCCVTCGLGRYSACFGASQHHVIS